MMISIFRETATSLKDLKYGQEIVKKTAKKALWYWTKYLFLVTTIGVVLSVGVLTYYTPQLPKLLQDKIPDADLTIKNGLASSNTKQPFIQGDKNFAFILDIKGKAEELDNYKSGVLILADKLVVKKDDGSTQTYLLEEFNNITLNKKTILDWLSHNQGVILGVGVVLILVGALLMTGFTWIFKVSGFLLWAVLLWIVGLILKKRLSYLDAFKLAAYASVLPFIISIFAVLSPGMTNYILQLGLFLLYALGWLWYLPTQSGLPKKTK